MAAWNHKLALSANWKDKVAVSANWPRQDSHREGLYFPIRWSVEHSPIIAHTQLWGRGESDHCHFMLPLLPSYDSNLIVQALRERRSPLRFLGKNKIGFYPLPLSEAQRIRKFLLFPDQSSSALDPCVGDGVAFEVITSGAEVFRYGIELDAYRAEQARQRIPNIVQGNTLEVQCPVECFGLLYLESPII